MPRFERPTRIAELPAGPVEYRLEQPDAGPGTARGTVLVCHGGHMRAGLPLGEEVFTQAGYQVLVPSRPGYGRTPPRSGAPPPTPSPTSPPTCATTSASSTWPRWRASRPAAGWRSPWPPATPTWYGG
ncbi:alpha/beta fold hydrolase [Thermocatellispora tengchongensis]|uniref:hypothetical protein n=1 Tax=Thermocatellispora tengchongensis TaxID=1073253 RepID=UPI00362EE10A